MLVVAGHLDEVDELDEDNNVETADLTIGGDANGPNLVIVGANLEDDTAAPGDRVSVEYGVQNQGNADVGNVLVGFYLVLRNSGQSPPPEIFLESEVIGNVEAGETEEDQEEVTIPSSTPPGDYTVAIFADFDNAIEESDETDNRSSAGILTVTGAVSVEGMTTGKELTLPASPNPASGALSLGYELARPSAVRLAVVDALGREVAVVLDGPQSAGAHAASLDASAWAPGVYLVRLAVGGAQATRTLTVAR